jgi:hypothetical protein
MHRTLPQAGFYILSLPLLTRYRPCLVAYELSVCNM